MEAHLTLTEIREICRALNISPTKQLGQNFVHDKGTLKRIVDLAELPPNAHVLEIGPGLGSLTLALLARGHRVTACEIDPIMASHLPDTMAARIPDADDRLSVINIDAMDLMPEDVMVDQVLKGNRRKIDTTQLKKFLNEKQTLPEYLVANLPYNVSVPVLLHILQAFPTLKRALVMVQREVAQRLCASPGNKIYGIPSVKISWWGTPRIVGDVSASVFWPVPRVDSSLVALDITQRPGPREAVFENIDRAFHMRRKTLRSNFKKWAEGVPMPVGWSLAYRKNFDSAMVLDHIFTESQVSAHKRAENLVLDDFLRLTIETNDFERIPATAKAPGKVNMTLRTSRKTDNGYHKLVSVFQSVNIWEEVTVTPSVHWNIKTKLRPPAGSKVSIPVELAKLKMEDNLAYKAVKLVLDTAGLKGAAEISIVKQVPVAGGMAGGSADAAAALVAANEAFHTKFGPARLMELGRKLGADVPNSLAGGTTLGVRYGDYVVPLNPGPTCWWVFAISDRGLSTAEVFKYYDKKMYASHIGHLGNPLQLESPPPGEGSVNVRTLAMGRAHYVGSQMHNDLEMYACSLRPYLTRGLIISEDHGAFKSIISGSGPTVAAICADKETATRIAQRLKKLNHVRTTFVAQGPVGGAHIVDSGWPDDSGWHGATGIGQDPGEPFRRKLAGLPPYPKKREKKPIPGLRAQFDDEGNEIEGCRSGSFTPHETIDLGVRIRRPDFGTIGYGARGGLNTVEKIVSERSQYQSMSKDDNRAVEE